MIKSLTSRLAVLALGCAASAASAANDYTLTKETGHVVPSTRGAATSTHFGWDSFEDPAPGTFLNDTTPDMGETTIEGVRFETTNGQLHRASSGNFYTGFAGTAAVAEKVTLVTRGTPGATGKTTIIVQLISSRNNFAGTWIFGEINGVAPEVIHGLNSAGLGQAWARWVVDGNAASYEFTLGGSTGAHMSFDKMEIDTFFSETGVTGDTMVVTEPAGTHSVLEKISGIQAPSSRGRGYTTYFGWETFGTATGQRAPIDDNTPDIGSDPTGTARFRTTNDEVHQMAPNGNLYLLDFTGGDLTLAEEITIPTNGIVGEDGCTTIFLQIASAGSSMGGTNFANTIFLGDIDGVAPEISVQGPSASTAQLWAKWVIPGNKPTYTVSITGVPNEQHYSFERVVVDTKFSRYGDAVADTMRAKFVEILTETLPDIIRGIAYSQQLETVGGTGALTWSLKEGSTLPNGIEFSTTTGTFSGTSREVGTRSITVQVVDEESNDNEITYELVVASALNIDSSAVVDAIKSNPYSVQLGVTGGVGTRTWALKDGSTLPAGLTLSGAGLISGTPSALGENTFTVTVSDTDGDVNEVELSIEVTTDLEITNSSLPIAVVGVPYSVDFAAVGGLETGDYTWSATGLPADLTLTAAGVLSGTPTAPSTGDVVVTVTDEDDTVISKTFALQVSGTYVRPVVNPINFVHPVVGDEFSYQLTAANYPKTFAVTGLPKGLKVTPATGLISGRASVAGVYVVQVRASNSAGTSATVSVPLAVKALPVAQVGSFTGLIGRDDTANSGLGAQFNLTTTTTGAFTVQVKAGTATKSAKGFLSASAPQVQINVNGADLALTLDAETGLVTGTHGAATANGWRIVWDKKFNPASLFEGYYSTALNLADEDDLGVAAIPQGVGYTTFTVISAGTVKIAGKSADGQKLTASTTLGPDGQLAVYVPLYSGKGSLTGTWTVNAEPEGLFLDNTVTGTATWQKPETKGRTYAAAFGPVDLSVDGGYLGISAKGPVALGLPNTGDFDIEFEAGGIELSATAANVTGAAWTEAYTATMPANNAAAVTLKINKASGAVTGTFSLTETTPPLLRKNVKFEGQVVRLANGEVKAAGFFLLPQIPGDGERATTSPILSGAVFVTQGSDLE